jgi:hypothetical protein
VKLTLAVLALTLAGFVSGCSPVVSIRPLYTDDDLKKPVVEPRIEGEWISPNTEEPDKAGTDEELWLRWKIAPPDRPGDSYSTYPVELRPTKPEPGKGDEVSHYVVRLVPMGDKLFFDAYFRKHTQGQFEVGRSDALGLVPAHIIGRLWVQPDFLRIALLDGDWVKDNSPASFREIVNYSQYGDDVTITGSIQELRDFLARNADNQKALAYAVYLCRPGTDCSTRAAEDALAHSPDDDDLLREAAKFFSARRNYARAVALRQHRVELDPEGISLRTDLSQAFLLNRDFAGARRELAAAQKLALAKSPAAGGALPYSFESGFADAGEGIVWSYFLEGAYVEAVNAATKFKPSEKHASVNPLLLSYFSMLRLGRRAAAESLLKEETAKFTGSAEEHILLLTAQGRVWEDFPYSGPKSEALRRASFFGGLRDIATGRLDSARVQLGSAASQPGDNVIALAAKIELERLGPKPKK